MAPKFETTADVEVASTTGVKNKKAAATSTRTTTASTTTAAAVVTDTPLVPPTSQQEQDRALFRLLRADLVANILLLIGGNAFIGFFAREIITFCRRDVAADVLYAIGFVGFFGSGALQFWIDFVWTRTLPFGRYSMHRTWNLVITTLFLWGVVTDFVAFMFWRQGATGVRDERLTLWFSSHFWLLAAVIVVATNLQRLETRADQVDAAGNACFFVEAILVACARYVTDLQPAPGEVLVWPEVRLEVAASVFWTCNAACYLTGDVLRLRQLHQIRQREAAKQARWSAVHAMELQQQQQQQQPETV